jgi:hypothetical protein
MLRVLFAIAALLAVTSLGARPAHARAEKPWCAVYTLGFGSVQWDCEYDSIETCRPNVIAGNRGFCNPNPYYRAPQRRAVRRHYRRYRRYR